MDGKGRQKTDTEKKDTYMHTYRDRQTDRGITGCGSYMISGAKSPVTMLVL